MPHDALRYTGWLEYRTLMDLFEHSVGINAEFDKHSP